MIEKYKNVEWTDCHEFLDHGYVRLVKHMGSDADIVESARMSTGKGFMGWGVEDCEVDQASSKVCSKGTRACVARHEGDEKLLRHLWANQHSTPFEFVEFVFEASLPIFAIREWHRHRTQSYSEVSARYVPLPDVNYIPSVDRILLANVPTTNK